MITLGVMFPIYINTFAAIRSIDPSYGELADVVGLSRLARIRRIVLPAALPGLPRRPAHGHGGRLADARLRRADQRDERPRLPHHPGADVLPVQRHRRVPRVLRRLGPAHRRVRPRPRSGASCAGSRADDDDARPQRRRRSRRSRRRGRGGPGPPPHRSATARCCAASTSTFGAGQFVALLGRSGSGKSTILRALAGLDPRRRRRAVRARRAASVVFQDPRLLPWARVLANVTLGLDGRDAAARGRAALDEVGLDGHEDDWPKTLSGGEAQRVALARALVREPRAAPARRALRRARRAHPDPHARAGRHSSAQRHHPAVLLVTHDVDEAILLADRVLVLTDGRLSLDVTVDLDGPRLRSDPAFGRLRSRLLAELGVDETAESADAPSPRPPRHRRNDADLIQYHPPPRTGDSQMTTTLAPTDLEVTRLSGTIGAEIRGVDLRDARRRHRRARSARPGSTTRSCSSRASTSTRSEHQAFAARFGELTEGHPVVPERRRATRTCSRSTTPRPASSTPPTATSPPKTRGIHWHTDVTFVQRPPLGSILRAVVDPGRRRRHAVLRPAGGVRGAQPGAPGLPLDPARGARRPRPVRSRARAGRRGQVGGRRSCRRSSRSCTPSCAPTPRPAPRRCS